MFITSTHKTYTLLSLLIKERKKILLNTIIMNKTDTIIIIINKQGLNWDRNF